MNESARRPVLVISNRQSPRGNRLGLSRGTPGCTARDVRAAHRIAAGRAPQVPVLPSDRTRHVRSLDQAADIGLATAVGTVEFLLPVPYHQVRYNRIVDQPTPQHAVDPVYLLGVVSAVDLRRDPKSLINKVLLPLSLDITGCAPRALLREGGQLTIGEQIALHIRSRQPQVHRPHDERLRAQRQQVQVIVRCRDALLMATPPQPRKGNTPRRREQPLRPAIALADT